MAIAALIPIEEKQVDFYDDVIIAVRVIDDEGRSIIYVPIRQLCDYFGIAFAAQRTRIKRDPVLSEHLRTVKISREKSAGGNPNVSALPLDFLAGWLFKVGASRVKPEARDIIIRYQKNCYQVLDNAFKDGQLTADNEFSQMLANRDSLAVQAYETAHALLKIAKQQVILENKLRSQEVKLEDHRVRIEAIEAQLGDTDRLVTPDEAMRISQGVRALALELGSRSGRNEFGGVYGELYRQFSIPGYKELPSAKFDECMNWLRQWWESLSDEDIPF